MFSGIDYNWLGNSDNSAYIFTPFNVVTNSIKGEC